MDKRTRDAILAEAKAADAIMTTAEREERELSDTERGEIDTRLAKCKTLEDDFNAKMAFRKQFTDLTSGLAIGGGDDDEPVPAVAGTPGGEGGTRNSQRKSVGQMWAESPEYKALMGTAHDGRFTEKHRVQTSPMKFGGAKDLFFSGDRSQSAGVLVENDSRGMLAPFFERPLSVRQLFTANNTTSDTIDYVRWASVTNNAAVVPEARSADPIGGAVTPVIGGVKPQSTFSFSRDQTTVKTIAHWIPITKRALADAAQMRGYIDSFLRYGLEEEFEDQLLAGNGTGENFLGLYNQPGIQTQAAPGAGQDNLDITKIARTKVQIGGRANPTAYVMNPLDWQDIELMRNDNGDFYGQGPFSLTAPRLWGLPVVLSEAVAPKSAWVADWNWGVIYDREQASVQATDSHADFFIRNMVAILAEMRAAFAILRPAAFVKITLA